MTQTTIRRFNSLGPKYQVQVAIDGRWKPYLLGSGTTLTFDNEPDAVRAEKELRQAKGWK